MRFFIDQFYERRSLTTNLKCFFFGFFNDYYASFECSI